MNWNAELDKDSGEWRVPCTFDPNAVTGAVTFNFDGGPSLDFVVQHFIDQVGDRCILRIRPRVDGDTDVPRAYWSIGLPFYRKFCTLFDFKGMYSCVCPTGDRLVLCLAYMNLD